MADYPGAPTYDPNFDARNGKGLPYFPPYHNKFMQVENGAFNYFHPPPLCETSNLVPGVPSLPLYHGQNQDIVPLHPYSNSQNGSAFNIPNAYDFQNNTNSHHLVSQVNYIPNHHVFQTGKPVQYNGGESENKSACGVHAAVNFPNTHPGQSTQEYYPDNVQNSYLQGAQALHSKQLSETENNQNLETTTNPEPARQQSDSYSPRISPLRTEYEPHSAGIIPSKVISPLSSTTSKGISNQPIEAITNRSLPPKPPINGIKATEKQTMNNLLDSHTSLVSEKSLDESKRKAQKMILDLWSHGVKYQTYIQEGFKKDLIDRIFKDLNLQKSTAPELAQTNGQPEAPKEPTRNENSLPKKPGSTLNSNSAPPQAPSEGLSLTSTKPSNMAEKEKNLRSKMEALRKSREARASAKIVAKASNQILTERQGAVETYKTTTEIPVSIEVEKSCTLSISETEAKKKVLSSVDSASQILNDSAVETKPDLASSIHDPASTKGNVSSTPQAIPGLFLASNSPSTTSANPPSSMPLNQRKRPVASDFDESSKPTNSFKRPFGHTRNDQRLVIDVSDDESEDEEIDMNSNSHVERASPAVSPRKMSNISHNIQLSSNSPARKLCTPSPNPTSQLPSIPSKSSILTPTILKQKQREIQLMKQKIALAEAQLKAKANGSSCGTPQRSENGASEIKEAPKPSNTSTLNNQTAIKPSEKPIVDSRVSSKSDSKSTSNMIQENNKLDLKNDEEKRLLRERIANELPIVEAELLRGQSRLDQLKTEMAQIEAGLKIKLDEKQRIADQIKLLGIDPEEFQSAQKESHKNLGTDNLAREEASALDLLDKNQANSSSPNNRSSDQLVSTDQCHKHLKTTECKQTSPTKPPEVSGNLAHNTLEDKTLAETKMDCVPKVSPASPTITGADLQGKNISIVTEKSSSPDHQQTVVEVVDSSMEEGELPSAQSSQFDLCELSEGESDNYEPPDATAPIQVSPVASPPFSPAPPEPIGESKDANKKQVNTKQADENNEENKKIKILPQEKASVPQQLVEEPFAASHLSKGYTPYKSPLKSFRAYRFHPNFKNEVSGGLRSITYSHKIDAKKEFCRFEMAGGVCNDSTCEYQHFKSITLPDDGIMAALGSPDEFKGERRDKYIIGLREVLLGLRLRKVKDFDVIASEIISHRARFLGDESKILALEGTTV